MNIEDPNKAKIRSNLISFMKKAVNTTVEQNPNISIPFINPQISIFNSTY